MPPTRKEQMPIPARRRLQIFLCAASALVGVLYFSPEFGRAQTAASACPTVSISTPNGLLPADEKTKFSAEIHGGSGKNLGFRWAISRGVIVSRSDAQEIEVRPGKDYAGHSLEIFVRVNEVGGACTTFSSTVAEVRANLIVDTFNDFGAVPSGQVKSIIDNYYVMLNNNLDAQGYIYFEHGENESRPQRLSRLNAILSSIRFRKYDITRISFAVYHCPTLTETSLWFATPGAKLPDENGPYTIVTGTSILKTPQLGVPKRNCTCPKRITN